MRNYFKTPDTDWYKQRLTLVMFSMLVVFAVLCTRLFYLQVIEGAEFKRLSENNCIRLESISPSRGLIYDRTGQLLVDNRPSFDLYITLKDAKPLDQTLKKLSQHTKLPLEFIKSKISAAKNRTIYKPILLFQDVGRDVLAAVEVHQYEMPGIKIDVKPRRHYIGPKSGAHFLGYLGEINAEELASGKFKGSKSGDYIGKFGVEKSLEKYLRGGHGGRQVEVNVAGQVVRVLQTVSAQPGLNIFLTIDRNLQEKTESLLKGKAGAAVAMDPTNGEILTMVSSPSFDQNLFVDGMPHETWNSLISNPDRPMENKAIQAVYPPASTYKMITAMAGLEEGIIDKSTTKNCSGRYAFGDRVFRCWKLEGHGTIDIVNALSQSCDVFFYEVGQQLGVDRLAWYARACGLGELTGIKLDQENRGLIPTAAWKKQRFGEPWHAGETLSIAIGQGYNLVTPLQILVCTAAIANGGTKYHPLIYKKIETPDGQLYVKNKKKKAGTLPAKQETLDIIKQGLFEAVEYKTGTGFNSRIDAIQMSGKTGTAQVVGRSTGSKVKLPGKKEDKHRLKPHAWFTAFAPSHNPKIAVTVIVEHGEHGSSAAAPIASEMIKTYLGNDEETKAAELGDKSKKA